MFWILEQEMVIFCPVIREQVIPEDYMVRYGKVMIGARKN